MAEPNNQNGNNSNGNNSNTTTGSNGSTQSGNGSSNGGSPPQQTIEATVAVRPERYLVAPRPVAGLAPMSADIILNALNNMPDVRIIRRMAPRGFNAFSTGGAPEVVVAEMDPRRGEALVKTAPPNIIVERDALLRHADDADFSAFGNTMSMLPGPGVDVRLRIVSTSGRPLPRSTVYVYGLGFPAQGLTDDKGEVTVTVFGGPIETVQAIYIKPYSDHWDRLVRAPSLSNGTNTLQLRPLSETYQGFPQTGMVGWGQRLMRLDQMASSLGGQGVKIGIIDSGCDNSHPQLTHVTRGADLTNANINTIGWTNDTISHGTHCAGIITAASNTLAGIRGFAPMAEVHALKVFPGGHFSDLLEALDVAIERQLDIVNMSLGSSEPSELVANKLVEARRNGVACIVAAGNSSGPVQFPGVLPSVFTVAALGMLDQFPPDSNHAQTVVANMVAGQMFSPKFTCFGPQIACGGPGVAIVSTVPGGGYAAWDGTSMATPHVTGMGALLLAHHPLLRDARTRSEQRVAQLFGLLANAGVRYLGDPTREGAGVADLQRAGLAGVAQAGVQPASAPSAGPLAAESSAPQFNVPQFAAAAFQGNPFAGFAPAAAPIGAFPNGGFQAGFGYNPALLQLAQLRAAGLI